MSPAASVLLPVFDAAATLDLCLRSIARQRQRDFECVIADDGSRDDSLAIARRWADRDPRFVVLALPHRGLVTTLNEGAAACRGEVIVRMDADDVMHRDRLAAQLAAFEEGVDAVGCHPRLFPRRALSDGLRRYERWLWSIRDAAAVRREVFVECPIAHPCLAVRRRTLLALGYRERGFPEDWDLVLRLVRGGHGLSMVPRRLLGWRDGPSRLSRNHPMYALQAFVDCRAHHLAAGPLEGHDGYLLWGFGDTGKALKRALLAFGKRPLAIVELHPGRIGQTIDGAEVVAPEAVPNLPPLPMLVSVAGAQARGEIRGFLDGIGRRETIDYHCCA